MNPILFGLLSDTELKYYPCFALNLLFCTLGRELPQISPHLSQSTIQTLLYRIMKKIAYAPRSGNVQLSALGA